MRKVCVVVTARASYARIKTVLAAVKAHPELRLQLVVSASAVLPRFGDAAAVMAKDGFDADEKVYMVVEGENPATAAKSTGLGLMELATVFDNLRPDVVVTIADRYETLATAVAAAYMNIPLAHVQGGEVTGSIDDKVRHAVTKLADLHFPATERAHEWIVRMGEDPERVCRTGCPSIDLAAEVLDDPAVRFDPVAKYGGVGVLPALPERYLVVMQHPVTTEFGDARAQLVETLHAVHELGIPTLWFWPNVDAGSDEATSAIRGFRERHNPAHIRFFKNMEPADFLRLMNGSACIVGNSSVAIREGSFLGVPAVNVGARQQDRERGANVLDVGHQRVEIRDAIRRQIEGPRPVRSTVYGDGRAGARIAEHLATLPLTFTKRLSYVRDGVPSGPTSAR